MELPEYQLKKILDAFQAHGHKLSILIHIRTTPIEEQTKSERVTSEVNQIKNEIKLTSFLQQYKLF